MEALKITRSELFLYVKIIVAFGIVSTLFSVYWPIHRLFVPNQFPTFSPLESIHGVANVAQFLAHSIASAWLLNRSEKRRESSDKFWLIVALIFGPFAVGGYLIWGLARHYQLILPEKHEYSSVWHTLIQAARRN